jgi:hypothetical protein
MGAPKGELTYHDRTRDFHLKSTSITTLQVDGKRAVIRGRGTVNGTPVSFQIVVEDTGEPGSNDSFSIEWAGYAGGAQLASGNIQVHRAPDR